VKDVSEVLAGATFPPMVEVKERAAYQEPCHLAHAQRIREAPRRLLASIPGLELVPLAESDVCCGAAGSYSLVQPYMSGRLLERKLAHILAAAPTVVVSANPGCMIQLEQGLRRARMNVPVVHFIELLDRALGGR
jgi:glycolate oxidase iron-sulfur subunit